MRRKTHREIKTDILIALRDPRNSGHLNRAAADEIECLRSWLDICPVNPSSVILNDREVLENVVRYVNKKTTVKKKELRKILQGFVEK